MAIFKLSTSKLMLFLPTKKTPTLSDFETQRLIIEKPIKSCKTFRTKDSSSMACNGTDVQDREEKVTNKQ